MTLRIAMINLTSGTKYGGVETFVNELTRNLSERDVSVDLYTGEGSIELSFPSSVEVFRFPYTPRERIWNLGSRFKKAGERLSFALHAWPELSSRTYDFIYVHKPFDLPLALYYRLKKGGKVIYSSHGTEFFKGYKKLVRASDLVLACSHFNAQQVFDYCQVLPEVLHNGVNTDLFRPFTPDANILNKYNIDSDNYVLFSAARLIGWKGIQYAIEAISNSSYKDQIRYLIAGEGSYREELERISKEFKVSECIKIIGRIPNEELPRYYSITNIALYPSVANETFGISIAEAMATDTPVISCRVGGIPEVVGDDSILVDPKNPGQITKQIDDILKNGFKGEPRKRIMDNFNWDQVTDNFLSLLASLSEQKT
jgi:glycosyltransferase involved in cell wall biosynthesis